ncbi:MAG: inositol monophosphatase [Candidatus Nanohaloarchaea archaeon]
MKFESRYSDELEAAQEAARKAGKVIDRYRRKGADIDGRKKSYNDIVTEADIEAQRKVVEVLRTRFPADAIKAEENSLAEDHSDRVWVVDPIDGTTNFFHGLESFCVSIGLRIGSENVLGVIHAPETGRDVSYIGLKGDGAYRLDDIEDSTGERLSASRQEMQGSLFTCYVRDGESEKREVQIAIIEELASREMVHRARGSAALDIAGIAEGKTEVLVDYLGEWDYAAGKAILEEAGGELDALETDTDQVLAVASSGEFHDEVRELVEDALERF